MAASLAALTLLAASVVPSAAAAEVRGSVRPAVFVTAPAATSRHALQHLTAGLSRRTLFATARLPGILDTISTQDRFAGFAAAVRAGQVADILATGGPFTLFVPSNQAFTQLAPDLRQRLIDDPDMLASLVRFHLVPGRLDIGQVESMSHLATVQGSTLAVSDISVVRPGIEASNGVIHVIDTVLIPAHTRSAFSGDSRRNDHHQPRTAR